MVRAGPKVLSNEGGLVAEGKQGQKLEVDQEIPAFHSGKKVLLTDESKFKIYCSNRRVYVRRRTGDSIIPQ